MANYGTIDGMDGEFIKGKNDIIRWFPTYFTLILCLFYMVPAYLIYYMVSNPVVDYWIDDTTCWSLILIPVIILIVHVVNTRAGKPVKYAILAGLVLPSLILFYFSNLTMSVAGLGGGLFSIDCNINPEKAALQKSWDKAAELYKGCIEKTVATQNVTEEYLVANFRVQDCTEYAAALKPNERRWNYLRMIEERESCTGFCKPGPHLWSKNLSRDSCSVAISAIFDNLVSAHSQQVQLITTIVLLATLIVTITMGPTFRDNGIDW